MTMCIRSRKQEYYQNCPSKKQINHTQIHFELLIKIIYVQNKSEHLNIIEQRKNEKKNYDPVLLFVSDEDDVDDDDRSSIFSTVPN
jgi:hypothetical protein